jgi:hypothetical protein
MLAMYPNSYGKKTADSDMFRSNVRQPKYFSPKRLPIIRERSQSVEKAGALVFQRRDPPKATALAPRSSMGTLQATY